MNTQENNRLIAEFMGSKTIRINVPFEYDLGEELPTSKNICNSIVDAMEEVQTEVDNGIISGSDLCMEALEYHTSWDWLMPVVEKIESLGYEFFIVEDRIKIAHNTDHSIDTIINFTLGGSKREATYKAVVEFINQYNK